MCLVEETKIDGEFNSNVISVTELDIRMFSKTINSYVDSEQNEHISS